MEPTLKIKNEDNAQIVVAPDSGGAPVLVDAGQEAELTATHLTSRSFSDHLAAGRARFVETVNPTKEQYLLARRVLPGLLRSLGGRFVGIHGLMEDSMGALARMREAYNKSWAKTEAEIVDAEDASKGAEHLFRAVNHFLKLKPEEDALAQIEAELAALQAEDLGQTGKPFAQWLAEFQAKAEELADAEKTLAVAASVYITPHAELKQAVKNAWDAFKVADHTTDIGAEVPAFP